MNVKATALVEQARKLIGTPWVHQGRSCSGVDCLGFFVLVGRRAGFDIVKACGGIDRRNYGRSPQPNIVELLNKYFIATSTPVPGSMLVFRFTDEKLPRHGALYAERDGRGRLIHACGKSNRVVEHGFAGAWRLRWHHSTWLIPGVDYG